MKKWSAAKAPSAIFKKQELSKQAKVSQFIYQLDETPILRKTSTPVSFEEIKTGKFQNKLKYLNNCLLKYRKITGKGRGIAAPQVGIPEAFAVIYTPEKLITIINPKITKQSTKLLRYPEMCMSAFPIIAPIIRPAWIEFEYLDEKGEKKIWNTKDANDQNIMLNRVFQHEIDHLNGIINIDRLKSPKEILLHSNPSFYKTAKFEEIKK